MEYLCRHLSSNILKKHKKMYAVIKSGDSIGYWTKNFPIPYKTQLGNNYCDQYYGSMRNQRIVFYLYMKTPGIRRTSRLSCYIG